MVPGLLRFEHVIIDSQGPKNPHIKAVGDVDQDGSADVVVASSSGGPAVWYEYPLWTKHVIAPSGRWTTDGKLVDMDGDNDLDLLLSDGAGNRLEWYENPLPKDNPAKDKWKRHIIGRPSAHDIKTADMDRDGQLEIVARQQDKKGSRITIWEQANREKWGKRFIRCRIGEGLALGDINSDGRPDVVVPGYWYEAPKHLFEDPWEKHPFACWTPDAVVRLADMNKDGRIDIIMSRSEGHYRLSWFEAPEDPSRGWVEHWAGGRDTGWVEHVIDDSVDYVHGLLVCDINNDGEYDIVAAEMHQSPHKRVIVYLNAGDAREWNRQVIAHTGSHNICAADIGNTGQLDIIGANWSGDYQPAEMWRQLPT
ncbi:MAG: VCBS repeat-containing protein [Candidatus Thorarchaeota archaeon]|nr:MAG: VCBS repeat-containing protein [Candidatus Thorarchaeota archaeon]